MSDDAIPNADALDALFRADAFARRLGAELVAWGGGWSRVRYVPSDDDANFGGVTHGGALFALGDVAFAVASNSWGREAVALTVEVQYLAAPTVGAELLAEARERSRSRRTGAYLIELTQGGELVASLHAMVYRLERWHLGAEAWDEDWRSTH